MDYNGQRRSRCGMADMCMGPYTKRESFWGGALMICALLAMGPCIHGMYKDKEKIEAKHRKFIAGCGREFAEHGKFKSYSCYEYHRPRAGCRL